jgi:tetratricopeptide (TPR) repeat protein
MNGDKNLSSAYELCKRGTDLKQKGNFAEALKSYNLALKINPSFAAAFYEKSDLPDMVVSDVDILGMEKIFNETQNVQDKIIISFALAKAYDGRGEYDKSFQLLTVGNKLKRQTVDYDPANIKKDVMLLLEVFTESEFIDNENLTSHSQVHPIFIVGMPRSGSTLVEQIISSHPEVYAGGELNALDKTVTSSYHLINMEAQRGKRLAGINKDIRKKLAADYLQNIPNIKKGQSSLTDKMPYNIFHIGWINLIFNNAKIIHVKREKLATIFSCYQQFFTKGHTYTYNLEELSGYYDSYTLLMEYWELLFSRKIYRIQYEDLITNQEEEIKRMIHYCGLKWDSSCLSFEKNRRTVTTASNTQVRRPIYRKALDHWKHYEKYLKSYQ